MHDFDDLFREPRLADILEQSVHNAPSKKHGKHMCMSVADFLSQARAAAVACEEGGTVVAEFDELNDMLMLHIADSDKTETYAVAAPRDPQTQQEELVLAAMESSAGLEALEKAIRIKVEQDCGDSDMADDEIEATASQLDQLVAKANNAQEAYMIELAAAQLRNLKGE